MERVKRGRGEGKLKKGRGRTEGEGLTWRLMKKGRGGKKIGKRKSDEGENKK